MKKNIILILLRCFFGFNILIVVILNIVFKIKGGEPTEFWKGVLLAFFILIAIILMAYFVIYLLDVERLMLLAKRQKRVFALKSLIVQLEGVRAETKKICLVLIDASCDLTKPVYFTECLDNPPYDVHEVIRNSEDGKLVEAMISMGTNFRFSHSGGYYSEPGKFVLRSRVGGKFTHSIWLSDVLFDHGATEVKVDLDNIELFYRGDD